MWYAIIVIAGAVSYLFIQNKGQKRQIKKLESQIRKGEIYDDNGELIYKIKK